MRLVKDLVDSRIVLYWTADTGKQLSTYLASLSQAEEWWKAYMFSRYDGEERRQSILDRRTNAEKRRRIVQSSELIPISPYGRRRTDIPVKVDVDLVADKLNTLTGL
ncbi:hypothetical protein KQ940_15730 [Marinobacterium sp. D7]|uniref:hypothetical protein n=1 Tax=Marinobacterium ramblicola TaxID=2849041 RepID=UPI001C2D6C48|nr:hypothetical protein [Marinobacterium ramblicola]MBV1789505.1 hypothetical protein [Marinobacterium ramblicola]